MNEDTLRTAEQWRSAATSVAARHRRAHVAARTAPVGAKFAVSDRAARWPAPSRAAASKARVFVRGRRASRGRPAAAPALRHRRRAGRDVGLACGGELWVLARVATSGPSLRRGASSPRSPAAQAGQGPSCSISTEDGVDGDLAGRARATRPSRRRPRGGRARESTSIASATRRPALRRGPRPAAAPRDRRRGRHRRSRLPAGPPARLAHRRDRPAREVRDGRAACRQPTRSSCSGPRTRTPRSTRAGRRGDRADPRPEDRRPRHHLGAQHAAPATSARSARAARRTSAANGCSRRACPRRRRARLRADRPRHRRAHARRDRRLDPGRGDRAPLRPLRPPAGRDEGRIHPTTEPE